MPVVRERSRREGGGAVGKGGYGEKLETFLGKVVDAIVDALDGGASKAKRTLCCDVKMYDIWAHREDCPKRLAADAFFRERVAKWQRENPKKKFSMADLPQERFIRGDTSGRCDACDYPRGGALMEKMPYVVGEECPYCGYIEKRLA
jgi:hypothetical protein